MKVVLAIAMTLALSACSLDRQSVVPRAQSLERIPLRFSNNPSHWPVVGSGRAGLPTIALDPNVYVDGEGYHLFYTSVFCREAYGYSFSWDPAEPESCDINHSFGTIGYAFSADNGFSWEFRRSPVVIPDRSGFDSRKIETAHVFRLGETLYMAYSGDGEMLGRSLPQRFQIGIARYELAGKSIREAMMDETRRFQIRATPLLPADLSPGRFDNNVQEPSVIVKSNTIELFYVGLGLKLPTEAIDAPGQRINSVGLGRAVLDMQLNVLTRSSASLLDGANITELHYFDGHYHLFAASSEKLDGEFHEAESIKYARSQDGLSWPPLEVILERRAGSPYDNWGVTAPTLALEPDRLILFYGAFGTVDGNCFPVPATGRFGKPVANGTKCLSMTIGRAETPR